MTDPHSSRQPYVSMVVFASIFPSTQAPSIEVDVDESASLHGGARLDGEGTKVTATVATAEDAADDRLARQEVNDGDRSFGPGGGGGGGGGWGGGGIATHVDLTSCGGTAAVAASALQYAAQDIAVSDTTERAKTKAEFLFSTSQITADEFEAGMNEEELDATYMFKYLLVFTAALESFAHGSNDTANATGPFSAVYLTYAHGLDDCSRPETPAWIMAVAGFFVFLGVVTMGHRVINTIGKELTAINYQRGFCIEFASTLTVVVASIFDMPVSTTHCQAGSASCPRRVTSARIGVDATTYTLLFPPLPICFLCLCCNGARSKPSQPGAGAKKCTH